MAGKTRHFGLAYFDYKDRLDTSISIKLERERFITIDEQLHGLYSVFGNGIVNGFRVAKSRSELGLDQLVVEGGTLFCKNRSYQSESSSYITDYPANGVFFVYADIVGADLGTKNLILYASEYGSSGSAVRLARCVSFNGEITSVDMTYRVEVSFKRVIENEIIKHKHNGTVSKIDLLREVKNKLPGARIDPIDANKVKYGMMKKERIPQLNHNKLKNRGIVTHAGLETLARSLQNINRQLLGEVASVNLLKNDLILKRKYPNDPNSSVNMITFIPGISPISSIDFTNSTANINLSGGCISGRPSQGGRLATIVYDDTQSFNTFSNNENCSISNGSVLLSNIIQSSSIQFYEGFENSAGNNTPIPGVVSRSESVVDNISALSDSFNVVSGLFSAKFTSGKRDKTVYAKTISGQKNWTSFNRLFLSVKSIQDTHPPVLFYIINKNADGSTTSSTLVQILSANEVTINPSTQNFKLIEIDISNYVRNNVDKLVFEITDATVDFVFYVDDIKTATVTSTTINYNETGFVRYRYQSSTQVVLKQIEYQFESLNGTALQCKFRTGSNIVELLNATFSSPISPNTILDTPCNNIEIEFLLRSNIDRSATPKLNKFTIIVSYQGGENRIEIDPLDSWENGTFKNLESFPENQNNNNYGLRIKSPLETKHLIYASNNYVQQIKNALPGLPPPESNISIFGYNGSNLLQSPQQIISSLSNNIPTGFDQPSNVVRLSNRNYLICDTYNNRVLEIDRSGSLVRGFGGGFVTAGSATQVQPPVPLCANFNPRTRFLQIILNREITTRNDFDITEIKLIFGLTELNLNDEDELVEEGVPLNGVQIRLSEQKAQLISDYNSVIFIKIRPAAVGLEGEWNSSDPIYQIYYGFSGLRLTVSDFTYLKTIFHPISAIPYDDNNWMICNSLISFDRIRAGLREDLDEFFLPVEADDNVFYIFVELSDEIKALNPRVTFINDETASNDNDFAYEPVQLINGSNIPFQGVLGVFTQSRYSAKVTAFGATAMANLSYLARFKVGVEIIDPLTGDYVEIDGSPFYIDKRLNWVTDVGESGSRPSTTTPSVIKLNINDSQVSFAYGNIGTFTFSDFTIGSVFKDEGNGILLGGMQKIPETLIPDIEPPLDDSFRAQAYLALNTYRGKLIGINTLSGEIYYNYDSPDFMYISDCSRTSNNEILVAESAILENSGRTIKIDSFGNIVFVLSNGQLSIINHVRESGNNTVIISV